MFADIIELRDFYQSPLGRRTQEVLATRVGDLWPSLRGERILVLGYGLPLQDVLRGQQPLAVHALMPAAQGVCYWPFRDANISSLVDLDMLPLPDNSIDRVIALHALEGLAEPAPLLREIWRVMKSGGRFLTIVPNRRGLWAHSDRTPFGSGQPYSSFQIKNALHHQGFLVERSFSTFYALPNASRLALSLAAKTESYAARLFPGFGGILLVEASKQLYAPTLKKLQGRLRLVLPLPLQTPAPQPG